MGVRSIVYSHSDYFDVLEIFLEQQKKFGIEDIIIFSNTEFNEENDHCIYKEDQSYSEKLKSCLGQIEDDYILYQHEDMFLYDSCDTEKIQGYLDFLKDSDYSFLRLSKTGNCILSKASVDYPLYEISSSSQDFFAVQPTIWKRVDFIKFLENCGNLSIWDLERQAGTIAHGTKGLMHFNNEKPRGGHFNSDVWPYVATAIVKGKWNFFEYYFELNNVEKVRNSERQKML